MDVTLTKHLTLKEQNVLVDKKCVNCRRNVALIKCARAMSSCKKSYQFSLECGFIENVQFVTAHMKLKLGIGPKSKFQNLNTHNRNSGSFTQPNKNNLVRRTSNNLKSHVICAVFQ